MREQQKHGLGRADRRRLLADVNRNLVFNALRRGPVSRADVARSTGLSSAAVSAIVSELIGSDLVREVGHGKSRGGRPPLMLRLNSESNLAIGAKVVPSGIFLALTDVRAEVVRWQMVEVDWSPVAVRGSLDAPSGHDPRSSVLDLICSGILDLAQKAGAGTSNILGVGIVMPGAVDSERGACLCSPELGWRDVAVAMPIAQRLGLPVLADNDVNALAVAEQWSGKARGVANFVVVYAGDHVTAGIVVDGSVYRGTGGAAGQMGHLRHPGGQVLCRCGLQGCLETVASDKAIIGSVHEALAQGRQSSLRALAREGLTVQMVGAAAHAGDALAREVLEKAGQALGFGIASLVNLFNPSLVVLTGSLSSNLRWESAITKVRELSFAGIDRDVDFLLGSIDELDWARGAACAVLGQLLAVA